MIIEPEWGHVAQIVYGNGVVRSLWRYSLDLNNIASGDVAKDKAFAKIFMKKWGYPVAPGQTFFEKDWADVVKTKRRISQALRYAKRLDFPVMVEPNDRSQGNDVFLANTASEVRSALNKIFKNSRVAIIEKYLPGRDYRIVVLDGKIISAYERMPLSVTGDGRSSILKLLKEKQKVFVKKDRDTKINLKDPRIKLKLKHQKLSFNSILPKDKKISLLDNANLSTGGDSVDVTNRVHPGFKKIAIDLTRKMGLRIAGVDLMVTRLAVGQVSRGNWVDISGDPKKTKYYIIEINAAPGLDHYVTTGKPQQTIVENMYLEVLKALGKKN